MANLTIPRPFVIIDHGPGGFVVQTWTPPSGIWRKSGEPITLARYRAAQEAAVLLAWSNGGAWAVSNAALQAIPREGAND